MVGPPASGDEATHRDTDTAGRRLLITGGAGFVGSSLALAFRRAAPDVKITALDNLRRRGVDNRHIGREAAHLLETFHAACGRFDLKTVGREEAVLEPQEKFILVGNE